MRWESIFEDTVVNHGGARAQRVGVGKYNSWSESGPLGLHRKTSLLKRLNVELMHVVVLCVHVCFWRTMRRMAHLHMLTVVQDVL